MVNRFYGFEYEELVMLMTSISSIDARQVRSERPIQEIIQLQEKLHSDLETEFKDRQKQIQMKWEMEHPPCECCGKRD